MNQNLNMQIADLNRQLADLNLQLLKQLEAAQAKIAQLQAELEEERNKLKAEADKQLLSPDEAKVMIGRSVAWLFKDRCKNDPLIPFVQERPGAKVQYRRHDLQKFIDSRKKPGKLRLSA